MLDADFHLQRGQYSLLTTTTITSPPPTPFNSPTPALFAVNCNSHHPARAKLTLHSSPDPPHMCFRISVCLLMQCHSPKVSSPLLLHLGKLPLILQKDPATQKEFLWWYPRYSKLSCLLKLSSSFKVLSPAHFIANLCLIVSRVGQYTDWGQEWCLPQLCMCSISCKAWHRTGAQ